MNNFSRGNTQLGTVWGKRDLTFKAELPPNEPSKSSQVKIFFICNFGSAHRESTLMLAIFHCGLYYMYLLELESAK